MIIFFIFFSGSSSNHEDNNQNELEKNDTDDKKEFDDDIVRDISKKTSSDDNCLAVNDTKKTDELNDRNEDQPMVPCEDDSIMALKTISQLESGSSSQTAHPTVSEQNLHEDLQLIENDKQSPKEAILGTQHTKMLEYSESLNQDNDAPPILEFSSSNAVHKNIKTHVNIDSELDSVKDDPDDASEKTVHETHDKINVIQPDKESSKNSIENLTQSQLTTEEFSKIEDKIEIVNTDLECEKPYDGMSSSHKFMEKTESFTLPESDNDKISKNYLNQEQEESQDDSEDFDTKHENLENTSNLDEKSDQTRRLESEPEKEDISSLQQEKSSGEKMCIFENTSNLNETSDQTRKLEVPELSKTEENQYELNQNLEKDEPETIIKMENPENSTFSSSIEVSGTLISESKTFENDSQHEHVFEEKKESVEAEDNEVPISSKISSTLESKEIECHTHHEKTIEGENLNVEIQNSETLTNFSQQEICDESKSEGPAADEKSIKNDISIEKENSSETENEAEKIETKNMLLPDNIGDQGQENSPKQESQISSGVSNMLPLSSVKCDTHDHHISQKSAEKDDSDVSKVETVSEIFLEQKTESDIVHQKESSMNDSDTLEEELHADKSSLNSETHLSEEQNNESLVEKEESAQAIEMVSTEQDNEEKIPNNQDKIGMSETQSISKNITDKISETLTAPKSQNQSITMSACKESFDETYDDTNTADTAASQKNASVNDVLSLKAPTLSNSMSSEKNDEKESYNQIDSAQSNDSLPDPELKSSHEILLNENSEQPEQKDHSLNLESDSMLGKTSEEKKDNSCLNKKIDSNLESDSNETVLRHNDQTNEKSNVLDSKTVFTKPDKDSLQFSEKTDEETANDEPLTLKVEDTLNENVDIDVQIKITGESEKGFKEKASTSSTEISQTEQRAKQVVDPQASCSSGEQEQTTQIISNQPSKNANRKRKIFVKRDSPESDSDDNDFTDAAVQQATSSDEEVVQKKKPRIRGKVVTPRKTLTRRAAASKKAVEVDSSKNLKDEIDPLKLNENDVKEENSKPTLQTLKFDYDENDDIAANVAAIRTMICKDAKKESDLSEDESTQTKKTRSKRGSGNKINAESSSDESILKQTKKNDSKKEINTKRKRDSGQFISCWNEILKIEEILLTSLYNF